MKKSEHKIKLEVNLDPYLLLATEDYKNAVADGIKIAALDYINQLIFLSEKECNLEAMKMKVIIEHI